MRRPIDIGRVRHLNTVQAGREMRDADRGGRLISDECAATIASWWQTPNGHGLTFATLASTGRVDAQDVMDACKWESGTGMYDHDAMASLERLRQWARAR